LVEIIGRRGYKDSVRRTPVESSVLSSVGYRGSTLEIQFVSGDIYRYLDVPEAVHKRLMRAESHGKFFNARIRDRFRYVRA
jgi:hypothetical protein